jgi:hypothetical protein
VTAPLHRLLSRTLLALALVFAQQVGLAHAATHLATHGPDHEHRKGLKTQACDDCLSFAQAQGAGQATLPTPAVRRPVAARAARPADGRVAPPPLAFRSRAPPALHAI